MRLVIGLASAADAGGGEELSLEFLFGVDSRDGLDDFVFGGEPRMCSRM